MCNTAGFTGGCGHEQHQQGSGHHQQQQQQQASDGGRGVSMLTHTPPCRYEDQAAADMGKRQRMYMSPGLWSVLDADPSQGLTLMDTRAAAAAAAQQRVQQLQQLQQLQAQQPRAMQQSQPLRDPAATAAPLAWTTPAAATGTSTAMDDDSPSRFFYISPTEPPPAAAAAAARAASASASAAMPPPPQQPPQQPPKPRAVTTDDMVASTYRPVLMTGNTPNSTSSIFCRITVCNPDADQIILCMSSVLQVQMLHDQGVDEGLKARFAFMDSPPEEQAAEAEAEDGAMRMDMDGARSASSQSSIPGEVTVEEIHRFVEGVFTRGRFSAECNIIALVYINRVISSTGMPLHKGNWKALVLVALLLAQKVWNDKGVPLSSVAALLPQPQWSVDRVRTYERRFLELLEYRATVAQALYTRYYFELRSLYEKLLEQENISREFPLKPLALWQARKLELCSDSFGLCQRAQPPGQSSTLLRNPSSSGVSTASISSSARPPRSAGTSGGGGGGGGFQPTTPLTPFPGGPLASAASAATQQSHHTHGGARGVAVMSPYSDIPQSPSLTYEDIVYQPKGRYVLG